MEALAAALEGDFDTEEAMSAVVEQLDLVRSTCTTPDAAAATAEAIGVVRLCDAAIAFGHRAGRYLCPPSPSIGSGCSDISLMAALTSSARLLRNLCIAGPRVQRLVVGTEHSGAASETAEGAALDGPAPATVLGAADRVIRNPFLADGAGAAFAKAAADAVRALLQCASNAVAGDDACRAAAWPLAKSLAAAALSLPHSGVRGSQLDAVACGLLHVCACDSGEEEGAATRLVDLLSSQALMASVMAASAPVRGLDQLPPCAHWTLLLLGRAAENGCIHHAVATFCRAAFGGVWLEGKAGAGAVAGAAVAGAGAGAAVAGVHSEAPAAAEGSPEGITADDLPDRDAISSLLMLLRVTRDTSLLSEPKGKQSDVLDRSCPDLNLQAADVDAVAQACSASLSGFLELSATAMSHVAAALSPGFAPDCGAGEDASQATSRAIVACLCAESALAALDLLGDALTAMHRRIDNGESAETWSSAPLGPGLKAVLERSAEALTVLPEPVRARSSREGDAEAAGRAAAAATRTAGPGSEAAAGAGAGAGAGAPAWATSSGAPAAPPTDSRLVLAWNKTEAAANTVRGSALSLDIRAALCRLAANAVHRSSAAATAAEQCGLLVALLGQTRMERGISRPVIREYSLLAVRNAVQCSAEARRFVEALQPKGVSDPEAMRAMGIKAEVDAASGRVTVGVDAASKDGGGKRWRTSGKAAAADAAAPGGQGPAAADAAAAGGPARSAAAAAAAEAAILRAVDDGEIEM